MCRHDGKKRRDCAGRLQLRSFASVDKARPAFWTASWNINIRDRSSNRATVIGPVSTQAILGDAAKVAASEEMKRLNDQMTMEWNKHIARMMQGERNGF